MASYHFHLAHVSRGAGQSAVAAAAYRAGECLRDDYLCESVINMIRKAKCHSFINSRILLMLCFKRKRNSPVHFINSFQR